MLTFGLLINPVAGMGGPLALKGSDGPELQDRARARGAVGRGAERAVRALAAGGAAMGRVRWLTWGGVMGEQAFAAAGLDAQVLGSPGSPPAAGDTVAAARAMRAAGAELLVFCGGDGTARDLLSAVGTDLPVLGVPSGVKMHSGVFAATPESAGRILAALIDGGLVRAAIADVRDLDEAALRNGELRPRFHGELAVPELGGFLQHTKEGGRESEPLAVEEIAAEIGERIGAAGGRYLLGPGSTLAALKRSLGMTATLIGFDALDDGLQVGADVDARWLERWLSEAPDPVTLVISFTRAQGFLIGRGNQQLSPAVLRRIGRDRLWVVGTRTKLLSLGGRPLLIDTDDAELDRTWGGLIEIVTGYHDSLYYRIDGQA